MKQRKTNLALPLWSGDCYKMSSEEGRDADNIPPINFKASEIADNTHQCDREVMPERPY